MRRNLLCLAALALMLLTATGCVKNGLIAKEETINEKWAEIDNMLKSRNDKLPALVAAAKKTLKYEQAIFDKIMDARARLAGGGLTREERMNAANEISGAIGRLFVFSENNPDVRGDKVMVGLMDEISGMENRLARARSEYNRAVKEFNTAIRQFPGSLYSDSLGGPKTFFEVPEAEKKTPDVAKMLED